MHGSVKGYRDEVTAFGEFRDAILLSAFASLKKPLRALWRSIPLREALSATPTDTEDGGQTASGCEEARAFAEEAFEALFDECQALFHDAWQGTGARKGLACRQIIRAIGLANDKWCEIWKREAFDPDGTWPQWANEETTPLRTYHYITTRLRGQASHAATSDACFDWRDVWIAILTFVLKVEGLARRAIESLQIGSTETENHRDRGKQVDARLQSLVEPLWHLLVVSGYLDVGPGGRGISIPELQERLSNHETWRQEHWALIEEPELGGEYVKEKGVECIPETKLLAVAPYILRANSSVPLIHEAECFQSDRSEVQRWFDRLVLLLIASRSEVTEHYAEGKG